MAVRGVVMPVGMNPEGPTTFELYVTFIGFDDPVICESFPISNVAYNTPASTITTDIRMSVRDRLENLYDYTWNIGDTVTVIGGGLL